MQPFATSPQDCLAAGRAGLGCGRRFRLHVFVQRVPFRVTSNPDDQLANAARDSLVGRHQPRRELGADRDERGTRDGASASLRNRVSTLPDQGPRSRPG